MRKLPNGKYMADEDPPWADMLANIILKSFFVLLMLLMAFFLITILYKTYEEGGVPAVAESVFSVIIKVAPVWIAFYVFSLIFKKLRVRNND